MDFKFKKKGYTCTCHIYTEIVEDIYLYDEVCLVNLRLSGSITNDYIHKA